MIDIFNLEKIYKIKKYALEINGSNTNVSYVVGLDDLFSFKSKSNVYHVLIISKKDKNGILQTYSNEIPVNTLEDLESDLRRLGIILVKIQPLSEVSLKNEEKITLNFDGKSFEVFKIVADAFGLINDQIIYKKHTYDSLLYANKSFESKQQNFKQLNQYQS